MFKERVFKQCRHVKFNGTMKKWPVHKQTDTQNSTKTRRTRNRHTEKYYFCDFRIFIFYLYIFLMISPRNVELPPWYGQ